MKKHHNVLYALRIIGRLFLVLFLSAAFILAVCRWQGKPVFIEIYFHRAVQFLSEYYRRFSDWGYGKNYSEANVLRAGLFTVSGIVCCASVWFFLKSSFYSKLKYRLSNRYAGLDDVRRMGFLDGGLMALGRFGHYILRLKDNFSVLCLGDTGSGKTSGVAIPSILESDGFCIVAADNRNELARYTSGYRSTLGKVFYFNWNLTDNSLKNEFYPRWNPLSSRDMPEKGDARSAYLSRLSRYFIVSSTSKGGDDSWEQLAVTVLDGLLNFFIVKAEQACANDYFLSTLLENGKIHREDKDILLSYYLLMPQQYTHSAIEVLDGGQMGMEDYLPIGSWEGIPPAWRGKEVCFAMFSDWLLQSYFSVKAAAKGADVDCWRILAERWMQEAEFFGYDSNVSDILRQIFYLSREQRGIVFPIIFKPLSVFRNSSVRERTSSSDFYLHQARGIKDPETNRWEVVTIYSVSGNKSLDFIEKLFIDMLIFDNLNPSKGSGPYPLLFVLDDVEQQPRYEMLIDGVSCGIRSGMSFLLLSDYPKLLHEKYGTSALEAIVCNISYKLMMADNCKAAADKFEYLAQFGTKSVQIPVYDKQKDFRRRNELSDAVYYCAIAKNLLAEKKYKLETGDGFLVSSGYYHLPVRVKCLYFLENETLKEKAAADANYFLAEDLEKRRNAQDVDTPNLLSVLHEAGVHVQNENDITIYLEDKFDQAEEALYNAADQENVSEQQRKTESQTVVSEEKDWWLEEDAFSFDIQEEDINPFK